jgi:hypothetical protein
LVPISSVFVGDIVEDVVRDAGARVYSSSAAHAPVRKAAATIEIIMPDRIIVM